MSKSDPAQTTTAGWVIGVMLAADGQSMLRHYYGVGHPDRAKAEWTAVDHAVPLGEVASGPIDGAEPVQALQPLTLARMAILGLSPGEVRALGWRYPRRWLS